MKDPQENSPVVSAPTTRSGGGSSVLMSATCDVTWDCRKLRTCWLRSETSICEGAIRVCASKLQFGASNPQSSKTTGRAMRNLIFCANELRVALSGGIHEPARVMVSPD